MSSTPSSVHPRLPLIARRAMGQEDTLRRPRALAASAQLAGAAALVAFSGILVVDGRFTRALIVALIPLLLWIANRPGLIYTAVLMPVLAATLIFGRAFAELPVERIYVLDATVLAVLVLTLPGVLLGASLFPRLSTVLLLLIGIALVDVVWAGATRSDLRQSVLVVYALWVFVGIAIARAGVAERFARIVYWSAIGTTILEALRYVNLLHFIGVIAVAQSLYIGYGLLLVVFAPELMQRNRWVIGVTVFQIAMLGLDEVRSVWVAFPLAILSTLLVTGSGSFERIKPQLLRFVAILVMVLVTAGVAFPTVVSGISQEAASIVSYSGHTTSDNNTKWRLTNWRYGFSQIAKRPLTGIQLGGPEVPPSVCKTGCNQLTPNDPTVLPGSDLHNSVLAIPLRFGIPAFLLFVIFELIVISHGKRAASRSGVVRWLLACHLLTLFTAMSAVVLEGPYMGIFFWLTGGLVIGVSSLGGEAPGAVDAQLATARDVAVDGR
jgi:hypothetical protein